MNFFISLFVLVSVCALSILAADDYKEKITRSQYRPDPYYDGRYYNNRDKYNQRYYNDNLLKQYKSDILGKDSRIVEQKLEPAIDGNFAYEFDTENGIHMDAHGTNIKVGSDEEGQKIDGSFAFVTPEGLRVGVHYTSDENGYRPVYTFDGIDAVRYSKPSPAADVTVTKSNEGN